MPIDCEYKEGLQLTFSPIFATSKSPLASDSRILQESRNDKATCERCWEGAGATRGTEVELPV